METEVREKPAEHRFELYVDGVLAGFVDWVGGNEALSLVHAEIEPRFGGRGLGTVLVGRTLDLLRSRGERVLPVCAFVASVMAKRPEYVALVPPDRRADYGLPVSA